MDYDEQFGVCKVNKAFHRPTSTSVTVYQTV